MLASVEETQLGFSEVSALLWREREALELLLFKLVEEQLIISAGHTRWLAPANQEIEAAVLQLRGTEVLRSAEVDAIAFDLGQLSAPTLSHLASVAPEPWSTVLRDHREAMLRVVSEIEQATGENRRLLAAGARAVRETLLSITKSVDTYDARGQSTSSIARAVLMDERA